MDGSPHQKQRSDLKAKSPLKDICKNFNNPKLKADSGVHTYDTKAEVITLTFIPLKTFFIRPPKMDSQPRHRGVQAANPPSGPEAPEQDKDDITSRLLAASAFSDLSLGTGCRNAYSPCCSLQRRPWPLWLMRFPPWKIPAYEPLINDVSSSYGFLDCPHCKYQIHTTSPPLVRNWQPPPHY